MACSVRLVLIRTRGSLNASLAATRSRSQHFKKLALLSKLQSLRRSFAALLRDSLDLHAVPRNLVRPERPANFGLPPEEDERLTRWMHESLTLPTWAKEGEQRLDEIEPAVLARWQPPLNLSKVTQASRRLRLARETMAAEAHAWAEAGDVISDASPRGLNQTPLCRLAGNPGRQ